MSPRRSRSEDTKWIDIGMFIRPQGEAEASWVGLSEPGESGCCATGSFLGRRRSSREDRPSAGQRSVPVSQQTPATNPDRARSVSVESRAIAIGRSWSRPFQNHSRIDRLCRGGWTSRSGRRLDTRGLSDNRDRSEECAGARLLPGGLRPALRRGRVPLEVLGRLRSG